MLLSVVKGKMRRVRLLSVIHEGNKQKRKNSFHESAAMNHKVGINKLRLAIRSLFHRSRVFLEWPLGQLLFTSPLSHPLIKNID